MLKGVPKIISPELLKVLCEMGHGDRIVLADGNFPCESMGKNAVVIRADSIGVSELLKAILQLFPLDASIEKPVTLMEVSAGDDVVTPIWDEFKEIVAANDERGADAFKEIGRFDFYDETRSSYCIVATGEEALYANVMLQKGVVK